ncbi:alpha/beta hydrolase family protein [Nocardia sp. NBC_01327]|uniref:alpha/beta hydrolase family protein n=1 Tax=Nocardia sp. NBC_01327 TaxID=2903593 RepID=UPI002E1310BC|nr:alpha/beta hydrolase [Nocardia sp. NBC_01327]
MAVDSAGCALEILRGFREGRIREAGDLRPDGLAEWPASEIEQEWGSALAEHGAIREIGEPLCESAGNGVTAVHIPVVCVRGGFTFSVAVDNEGLLIGWTLAPIGRAVPWACPDYADTGAFTETEVMVGDGPLAVPGTLTVPRAGGKVPGVALLAGSGANDRDETLSGNPQNKSFKDLAWGLATRGVAVLRFDKVTRVHGDMIDPETLTPIGEYVDPAKAAIHLLQQHPSVDPDRVFLLGHSLGGSVAPNIASTAPSIAGVIVMAGGAQPPHHSLLRQIRYLSGLSAGTDVDSMPHVRELAGRVALLDSPEFSAATAADRLPFNLPARYWIGWLALDPVGTAATVDKPFLVLQGGRDYQVTVGEDFAAWQTGLGGRLDVTTRVYPADNHQFFSGTGLSSPADYLTAQHVDPVVVGDIADWIIAKYEDLD